MKVSNVFLSIMLGSSLVIAGCGGSPTNNNGDGQKKRIVRSTTPEAEK